MLCADLVELKYLNPAGSEKNLTANLEDISTSGVCLQTDEAIDIGTRLEIVHSQGQFWGDVRYCTYSDPVGYFLGIEFHGDCQWTERQFKPMHLLDPQSLVHRSLARVTKTAS